MKEIEILRNYIKQNNVRHSKPREQIITEFLKAEKHLSVNDIYRLVQKKFPTIGIATIYRSMKIACEAGLAREIDFGDGKIKYEHHFDHGHHDHLVCVRCGVYVEIVNDKIEKEQKSIAEKNKFKLITHRHVLYGICQECKN